MFWLYAAPAARMAALQKLRWIGIATHDSICTGDNGPTHQPVSLASFYRSLPDINIIRPADAEEVVGAYQVAMADLDRPSILSLSRNALPLLPGSCRDGVAKGACIVHKGKSDSPDIVLLATGGEVSRAISTAQQLQSKHQFDVRVVSFPSFKHFDRQSKEYRQLTIPTRKSLVIAIEAWASFGWSRYAHAGFHMHTFGRAAPEEVLYEHFGFGVDNMTSEIAAYSKTLRTSNGGWDLPAVGEYHDFLDGFAGHHQ